MTLQFSRIARLIKTTLASYTKIRIPGWFNRYAQGAILNLFPYLPYLRYIRGKSTILHNNEVVRCEVSISTKWYCTYLFWAGQAYTIHKTNLITQTFNMKQATVYNKKLTFFWRSHPYCYFVVVSMGTFLYHCDACYLPNAAPSWA